MRSREEIQEEVENDTRNLLSLRDGRNSPRLPKPIDLVAMEVALDTRELAEAAAKDLAWLRKIHEEPKALANVKETTPPDVAAAVTTFAAWLTCRPGAYTIGSSHDASEMAELVEVFRVANNIPEPKTEVSTYRHPDPEDGEG